MSSAVPKIVESRPLPAPTSVIAQGCKNLDDYGVTIHPNFVSREMCAGLLDRLDEQAAMERRAGLGMCGGPHGLQDPIRRSFAADEPPPIYQLVQFLPNKGQVFIDLCMLPAMNSYAAHVFQGEPWHVWTQQGILTRRTLVPQMPHIDQGVVPPAMCTVPALINVFLCLVDVDADMGATRIAPGSHLGPRPRYDGDHLAKTNYNLTGKAGTAFIWEGRTWHGGGDHQSAKTRYVIATDLALAAIKPNENYPAGLTDETYGRLSEIELDRLGFRAESRGFSNRFGPRNADDTRTNTNVPDSYVPELRYPTGGA